MAQVETNTQPVMKRMKSMKKIRARTRQTAKVKKLREKSKVLLKTVQTDSMRVINMILVARDLLPFHTNWLNMFKSGLTKQG